mgnify:CR=1 FL=1
MQAQPPSSEIPPMDKAQRAWYKQQRPCVLWLSSPDGASLLMLACLLERVLARQGAHTYLLDGRQVCPAEKTECCLTPACQLGEVSRLMVDAGLIVIVISLPVCCGERQQVRARLAPDEFIEVFLDVEATADAGAVPGPAELYICTLQQTPRQITGEILRYLLRRRYLPSLIRHRDP